MQPNRPTPSWDGETWTVHLDIPALRGLLAPRSNGKVRVKFSPEVSRESDPPSAEQLATLDHIVSNEQPIRAALLGALRTAYDKARPGLAADARQYPKMFPDFEKTMPAAPSDEAFAALLRLHTIYVQPFIVNGLAIVGFGFGTKWEEEHGVGVLVHGASVLSVGGEDTAFLRWVAKREAEKLGGFVGT